MSLYSGLVQHSIDESCSQTSQKLTAVQPRVTREREEKGKPRSVEVSSGKFICKINATYYAYEFGDQEKIKQYKLTHQLCYNVM